MGVIGGGDFARIRNLKKIGAKIFCGWKFFHRPFLMKMRVFITPDLYCLIFVDFWHTSQKFDVNSKSPPPENNTKSSLFSSRFSLKIPKFRFYNRLWSSIKITEKIKCIPYYFMSMLFFNEIKGNLEFLKTYKFQN